MSLAALCPLLNMASVLHVVQYVFYGVYVDTAGGQTWHLLVDTAGREAWHLLNFFFNGLERLDVMAMTVVGNNTLVRIADMVDATW